MKIEEKIEMLIGESDDPELDQIMKDNKKFMAKLRKMKSRWDNNRLNPKLKRDMKQTMDNISYGHLSKKQQDQFERIENSI